MLQIEPQVTGTAQSLISGIICTGFLFSLSVMDFKYRKIPGTMLIMAGILAAGYGFAFGREELAVRAAGLGTGLCFVVLSRITKESLGYGDSLLFCILGIYLGVWKLIEVLLIAWMFAALSALLVLTFARKTKKAAMPMIPFIMAGFVTVWIGELAGK